MKYKIFTVTALTGDALAELFGGWDKALQTLLIFMVVAQLDSLLGVDYVRDAVCIGFIANEALSIVENAGLMGIPLPEGIKRAVDVLQTSAEGKVNGDSNGGTVKTKKYRIGDSTIKGYCLIDYEKDERPVTTPEQSESLQRSWMCP